MARFSSIAAVILAVAPAAFCQPVISPATLPNGGVGQNYSVNLTTTTDGTTTWSISAGTLPPGLNLSYSSGSPSTLAMAKISGVPTAGGSYTFTVRSMQPTQVAGTRQYTVAIGQITNTSPLPGGQLGVPYSTTFTAFDGAGSSFTWTTQGPPPGLSLNSAGILSGTPINTGTFSFTVAATDAKQQLQVQMTFSLTVAQALTIQTISPLTGGVVGTAYSQNLVASGGFTPYAFSFPQTTGGPPITAPPGMTLSAAGVLSGTPTTPGTYSFTVQVTDSQNFSASKIFQITISAATPLLLVSPLKLNFTAPAGGDAAPVQTIAVVPSGQAQVQYSVTVDGGAVNTAAPAWLSVKPVSGIAPAGVRVVADPGSMQPGTYQAGLHILTPKNPLQVPIDVAVTFVVTAGSPKIEITPAFVDLRTRGTNPAVIDQVIVVRNVGGGGPIGYSATVVGKSSWISSVTPSTGSAGPNAPAIVHVKITPQGQQAGLLHDIVRFTPVNGNASASIDVPIAMFVASPGAVIDLSQNGVRFAIRQGNGTSRTETIQVLNIGDDNSTVNWTADIVAGADWLNIAQSRGTSTPSAPGSFVLSAGGDSTSLPVGGVYALVRVSDANAHNSPAYLVAVLDVQPAASPATPDPPRGVFLTQAAPSQVVTLFGASATPLNFQAAASTSDGANWLSVSPVSGNLSTQSPVKLTVTADPSLLSPGIYTGNVNVSIGGVMRSGNVTFAVPPKSGSAVAGGSLRPLATGCSPTQLAVTQTGIVNNFTVPAGWPASLIVQLNDDCGNAVTGGSVVARFTNGDPPKTLNGPASSNVYSTTWQPGVVSPSMSVMVEATAASFAPVQQQFVGGVDPNSLPAPTLIPHGTLHIFFDVPTANALGNGLAPGNVAQVYGTSMAIVAQSPGVVPLKTDFSGTFMLIGGIAAPLYYVSSGLIDVQIPSELAPGQYWAVVSANGALTDPELVTIVANQPGIAVYADSTIIAQHVTDNYSLVTAAHPAKPGEAIVMYLAGMGATNPAVASGVPTPAQAVYSSVQPTMTIDGQKADIGYAGLTPSGIGLYQINFTVPANARSGLLDVVVKQGDIPANPAKLPVSN